MQKQDLGIKKATRQTKEKKPFTIKIFLTKIVTKSFSHFLLCSFVDQNDIFSKPSRPLSGSRDPIRKGKKLQPIKTFSRTFFCADPLHLSCPRRWRVPFPAPNSTTSTSLIQIFPANYDRWIYKERRNENKLMAQYQLFKVFHILGRTGN